MVRTKVLLTEDQVHASRSAAATEHISVAAVVWRAVDAWVAARGTMSMAERRRRALNVPSFDSGVADLAERHDENWEPARDEAAR